MKNCIAILRLAYFFGLSDAASREFWNDPVSPNSRTVAFGLPKPEDDRFEWISEEGSSIATTSRGSELVGLEMDGENLLQIEEDGNDGCRMEALELSEEEFFCCFAVSHDTRRVKGFSLTTNKGRSVGTEEEDDQSMTFGGMLTGKFPTTEIYQRARILRICGSFDDDGVTCLAIEYESLDDQIEEIEKLEIDEDAENVVSTSTFGGNGGDPFPTVHEFETLGLGTVGFQNKEALVIRLNDCLYGKGQPDTITLDTKGGEYLCSFTVGTDPNGWISFIQFTTNQGRILRAAGGTSKIARTFRNVRVLSLSGRSGSVLDQLKIEYLRNYNPDTYRDDSQ